MLVINTVILQSQKLFSLNIVVYMGISCSGHNIAALFIFAITIHNIFSYYNIQDLYILITTNVPIIYGLSV